ncbi:hypothetical protein JOC86_002825 [Bacillus pakistanensis]|uniref:Uncharacterized protein n=1 Tax=Rossellomorea pakistanensis TaxID=992288 RepID=A0ABS2NEN9_9BACI|nr:hypothetical protein [Bacillus pakistanensis]MBM7586283.1 hypothetical protein [Bacillus pakistanensis]
MKDIRRRKEFNSLVKKAMLSGISKDQFKSFIKVMSNEKDKNKPE